MEAFLPAIEALVNADARVRRVGSGRLAED
jgi:hypothetical protein